MLATLISKNGYRDEYFLVMALTGKAASNICGLTLYLRKEGLSLPACKCFKDLDSK